jgi:AsmA family protein
VNRHPRASLIGRVGFILIGLGISLLVLVLACEALGWPFLVGPLQRRLASSLDRTVDLSGSPHAVRIRLLGSVRLRASHIEVGAPTWSSAPHTFLANDVSLRLTYGDLWQVYRQGRLRIDDLEAEQFDMILERQADGRASWEFKPHQPSASGSVSDLPTFGRLRVAWGRVTLRDAKTPLDITARYSLSDGSGPSGSNASAEPPVAAASQGGAVHGLQLTATGRYKTLPLRINAQTDGVLMLEGQGGASTRQPLRIDATIGPTKMTFAGAVIDPLHLTGLQGRFEIAGPSLDAAGEPLGVTLPVTPKYNAAGILVEDRGVWKAVFDHADIGSSKLMGAFTFDKRSKVALLAGRLQGSRLALADLGPAIGHAKSAAGAASAPDTAHRPGKVIPDQAFDLPSLRVMNANVLIDIEELDLGTSVLEPLRPARAHLTLSDGLLTLDVIEARTAKGELGGMLALDGRQSPARWTTNLRVRGVQLAQWLHPKRSEGDPPYVSGVLEGQAKVDGSGRSVAEILASLNGEIRFHVTHATLSHLALKAAGLDVAGAIKVLFSGDEVLPVHCNVADLRVSDGVIRPQVFVVSLDNATIWADGEVSLADEQMNVRAVSAPKDFSPFTLRTPITVKGPLSKPTVSLEPSRLVGRAGAAVLLGLLNPLAAVVPFLDPGARETAKREDAECAALLKRLGSR